MAELSLWFSTPPKSELLKSSFAHPFLDQTRLAIRGKTLDQALCPYTFQWSPAVRALSALMVSSAIHWIQRSEQSSMEHTVSLVGGQPSAALSLDNAIAKQPVWLSDMFGTDQNGNSIIRRLVTRINSGKKRPGPVAIAINERALPLKNIRIFFGDCDISSNLNELRDLLIQLDESRDISDSITAECTEKSLWHKSREFKKGNGPPITSVPILKVLPQPIAESYSPSSNESKDPVTSNNSDLIAPSYLVTLLEDELNMSLRSIDIFSRNAVIGTLEAVWKGLPFASIAGTKRCFLHEVDLNLYESLRVGCINSDIRLENVLKADAPIRIALPGAMVGNLALFVHMKMVKGYNLEINYHYPSTGELLLRMINGDFEHCPDYCGLSIATTGALLGSKARSHFSPLMFGAKTSHRVVAPRSKLHKQSLHRGTYIFDTQPTSTTSFFFSDMESIGLVSSKKVGTQHMLANEMAFALRSGDPDLRAILWFPFDRLNVLKNECTILYGDQDPRQWKETVLFARDSILNEPSSMIAFDTAVRNSWLELLESPKAIRQVTELMLADTEYLKAIMRFAGMHDFAGLPNQLPLSEKPSEVLPLPIRA